MKVISISTDRKVFEKESAVRARALRYATLVKEMHIIVFSKHGFRREKIGENLWLYPTNSFSRFAYMSDAIRVGKGIIKNKEFISTDTLITTQDPFETGLVGRKLSNLFGFPLHVQIHTDFLSPLFASASFGNYTRVLLARRILRKADAVRVVSERIADSLVKRLGLKKEKVTVLPIFVDSKKIQAHVPSFDLRKKYPQFDFVALMMSRFEKEKNIPLALRAIRQVLRKYPKTGLVIIGSGSLEQRLKAECSLLGITESVVFEEWTNDALSCYKSTDAFLSTSNYEGYGLTLVEAALCKTPIVTTDVGLIGSAITRSNIFLSSPRDEKGFAAALLSCRGDRELARSQAEDAFDSVKKSNAVSEKEYLDAYLASWRSAFV